MMFIVYPKKSQIPTYNNNNYNSRMYSVNDFFFLLLLYKSTNRTYKEHIINV